MTDSPASCALPCEREYSVPEFEFFFKHSWLHYVSIVENSPLKRGIKNVKNDIKKEIIHKHNTHKIKIESRKFHFL